MTMQLNENSVSPLYKQLTKKLRDDIVNGVYPVYGRIPSEQELQDTYSISRVTVRKALEQLTKEGLLDRQRGKGTFVAPPKMQYSLREVTSFYDMCRMKGMQPTMHLQRMARILPEDQVRSDLMLTDSESVLEIVRICKADSQAVMLEMNYFPSRYSYLMDCDLNGSLYAALKRRGVEAGQAVHDVSLVFADADQASALDIEAGDAVLYLREIIYDKEGQPLHVSKQYIRGDRFTFRI